MEQRRITKVMENSLYFITPAPAASEFFGVPPAPILYPSALKENGPLSIFFREYFSEKTKIICVFSLTGFVNSR
jgi:hypothetical protein